MKCPQCGHDAEMHWYPGHPDLDGMGDGYRRTTACRDCLPRSLYPYKAGRIDGGMCARARDSIDSAPEGRLMIVTRDVTTEELRECLGNLWRTLQSCTLPTSRAAMYAKIDIVLDELATRLDEVGTSSAGSKARSLGR